MQFEMKLINGLFQPNTIETYMVIKLSEIPSIILKMIHIIRPISEIIIVSLLISNWATEIRRSKLLIAIILSAEWLIPSEIVISIVPIPVVWSIMEIIPKASIASGIASIVASIVIITFWIEWQKTRRLGRFLWFQTHFPTETFVFVCLDRNAMTLL